MRDGLRDLITHKGALDSANMAGSISKSNFLAAEKRFTQARTAILHRVKGLNSQIKNLTDLVRHDVPVASERPSRMGRRSRNRSRSRSPREPGPSHRMNTAQALSQAALLNTSRGLLGDQSLATSFTAEQIRFAPTNTGIYVASSNNNPAASQFLPISTVPATNAGARLEAASDVVDLTSVGIRTLHSRIPSTQSAFVNVSGGGQAGNQMCRLHELCDESHSRKGEPATHAAVCAGRAG